MAAVYFNRARLKETLRRDFPFHATMQEGYVGYGRQHLNWTRDELQNMNLENPNDFTEITPFQAELPLDNDIRKVRYHAETVIGVRYFYNHLNAVRQEVVFNYMFDADIDNWVEPYTLPRASLIDSIRAVERTQDLYDVSSRIFKWFADKDKWFGEKDRFKRLENAFRTGNEAELALENLYDSISHSREDSDFDEIDAPLQVLSNPELEKLNQAVAKESEELQRQKEEFNKAMKILQGVLKGLNLEIPDIPKI